MGVVSWMVGTADGFLADAAKAGTPPAPADWTQAAVLLELAQRQRPGGAIGEPVQRIWHHAYPAADARSALESSLGKAGVKAARGKVRA